MDWAVSLTTAQTVREILLSLALFVGGGWAVYRYWYLERREAQLEIKRLESQIGLSSYLNIEIHHRLRAVDDAFDLIGDVAIHNPGTRNITFDLTQVEPIRISRLRLGESGQYGVDGEPLSLHFLASESINTCLLEPNGSASMKFVARLAGPELYVVEFWSRIASGTSNSSWMAYVIVEVSAAAAAAQLAAADKPKTSPAEPPVALP